MSTAQTDIDKRIGARVRAARIALGVSQSTIGEALNLTYQQVQKYERGTNRLSVGTLQRIAERLGMPASVFLDPEHRASELGRSPGAADDEAFNEIRSSLRRLADSLGKGADSEPAAPDRTSEPEPKTRSARKRARQDRVRAWQRHR